MSGFTTKHMYSPKKRGFHGEIYHFVCPKCNNSQNSYRSGKDSDGYQKYQCRAWNHQFAPDRPSVHIRPALVAEKLVLFTMIMNTIQTTGALTSTGSYFLL